MKNEIKNNLHMEQILSIFNSNIPRKINFNSFINNNTPINFNNNYCDIKNNEIKEISYFNPYDSENDNIFPDNFNRNKIISITNPNNDINKENYNLDNNINIFHFESGENMQNNYEKSDLFIKKISNYINNPINEEDLNNKIIKKVTYKNQYFSSPKVKRRKNNAYTHISQYSVKKQKKKKVCFTDLKEGLDNIKIRSTNYSSNLSFDNHNKNNKKEFIMNDINPLNKININNNIKNNKNKKKINKTQDNTYIKNKKQINKNCRSSLNNNKNKENITEKKIQRKKIPMLRSTIQFSKKLKTIDEYMELKRSKSKPKNSHSKKKDNNHEKNNIIENIKLNINENNKKEKNKLNNKENKDIKKINSHIIKDNVSDNNDENQTVRKFNHKKNVDKHNNNNNDKKIITKKNKTIKSIPKIKNSKSFFKSFLCCFGHDSCYNIGSKEDCNKNNKINTEINNNINDKKSRNKSSKKKKRKNNNE